MLRDFMWIMMLSFFTILLFDVVAADVLITYPAGGETLSGIKSYTVTWMESNITPLISDLQTYTIYLYAGTNDNYTEIASTNLATFTDDTARSNIMSLSTQLGPNSNTNAYFLGIMSTLKGNASIRMINFSNRFSIMDMDSNLSFNPPISPQTPTAPPITEFACGSQMCPSSVALSNLTLETPTGAPITSIPSTVYKLGNTGSGSDPGNGDFSTFSFNVVTVILGVAGILFTILCLAVFVIFRRRGNGVYESGGLRKEASVKWWNKLPKPAFGASELSAGPGQYETAELPGEEGRPVFELPAGSIRRPRKEGSKSSKRTRFARTSNEGTVENGVGLGIQVATPHSTDTASPQITESETTEARETTNLLTNVSPSHSRSTSATSTPQQNTQLELPSRSPSPTPSTKVSAPPKNQAELQGLAGSFGPHALSESELRVLAGVQAPLPVPKPKPKPKYNYVYK